MCACVVEVPLEKCGVYVCGAPIERFVMTNLVYAFVFYRYLVKSFSMIFKIFVCDLEKFI